MNTELQEAADQLIDSVGALAYDPLSYVKFIYPWGEGELLREQGPRKWQGKVLMQLRDHMTNEATRYTPFRVAVSSGHGIGKTALIAWLIDWGLSTREDTKVVVTANTDTQMKTKIKPEIDKWFHLSLTAGWWSISATSITSKVADHERTWRMDMTPWAANNPQAFAGLHNKGKRIIIIFDEASEIDDKIYEVVEGATTDENTEIIWVVFSNPTQNTGRFRECFAKFKHRWVREQIDARTVEGTNKTQLQEWIDDWGEDSDFVRIRVRGEFPRIAWNQFINSEDVDNCLRYHAEGYATLAKILALDVARFGDDQSVLASRQGRKSRILQKWRGLDTQQLGEQMIRFIEAEKPDAVVVDGDGIGGAIVDYLKARGYDKRTLLVEFHGGVPATDGMVYFNRRAEAWGLMRDALKGQMEIPNDADLKTDLIAPKFGFSNRQQIQLEGKKEMKSRGQVSPDCGDALAMTFAVKVMPRPKPSLGYQRPTSAWS